MLVLFLVIVALAACYLIKYLRGRNNSGVDNLGPPNFRRMSRDDYLHSFAALLREQLDVPGTRVAPRNGGVEIVTESVRDCYRVMRELTKRYDSADHVDGIRSRHAADWRAAEVPSLRATLMGPRQSPVEVTATAEELRRSHAPQYIAQLMGVHW